VLFLAYSYVIVCLQFQSLLSENVDTSGNLTRKMQLIIAARHHLEEGHEKYIRDTIQNHPAQVKF
jgi:nuclear pore complex protein Nup93